MRPVWLQMKAFGPYAGTQVVDFRELGANRLFLITGSTGAGKSTILDAICFALYGRTSGKEREGRQMRSDFASPDDPTEVTLDFSLGENCYRIWRTPEQDRPRKRGSGTVSQKPDATLWKISAPGEEHGAKTEVIASQWSKVTAEVIDLLGFEHDQFRQVIMLPQGQFRKVLNAGSKEREDILEVLFRTGIFSQIEEALKLAAKDLSADMDRLKSKSQIILGQAGAEDRNELDELCKRQEKSAGEFEARLKALRKKEESAREALEAASRLEEKFAEREQADLALSELEAEKSEIEMDRSRLERARKASKLAGVEDNLKDRLAEAEERREQAASSEEELERAETARAAAMTDFAREKKKTGRRDRTQKRLHQLDGLATKVGELESSLHNLAAAEDHVKALRDERDSRKADLKKLRAKIRSLKKSLEKKSKKAGAAEALEEKSRRSRKELEQRRKLTAVRGTLSQARKDRTAARKVLKAAGSECEILRKKIERLETLWRSAQAGILARGLRKGRPCPVCGSTEHPEPARLEKNVPEESTLVELRARLERLENKREEMRGRDSDARAGVSRLEAEIDSLKEALGAGAGISLKRLEAADRKLGADLETARRARDEAEKMSGDLRGLKDEERAAVRAFEDAEAKLTRGLEARALNQATVKERQAAIPRSLRTASALEDARREARTELEALTNALDEATVALTTAREDYASARTALKTNARASKSADAKAASAKKTFDRKVRMEGFSGLEDFEAAKIDDTQIAALDRRIRDFEGDLKAAGTRAGRARKALVGRKRPDLPPLVKRAGEATLAREDMFKRLTETRKELEIKLRSASDLDRIAGDLEKIGLEFAVTGRISEVANGKNPLRLTFQRFVLSSLLDDVLLSATERLKVMSRSRFHLSRISAGTDRRQAGGLDLEVYDAHTGKSRDVSTLSGGEGFLASLALALGLADVVQARTGGIRLEAIFVDEGFGTLDPESLDQVMQALFDLGEGQRLVGIISHVPELKRTISARLEVTSSLRGSAARFVT